MNVFQYIKDLEAKYLIFKRDLQFKNGNHKLNLEDYEGTEEL